MNATALIAWKEFCDDFRSRWTVALTVLFALLALAIAWFGGAASGKVGFTSFDATLASLTTLGAFVIPLIGLLLAYDTIVGERSDGTLLLLLSYPLPRSQLVAGKFLGHCLALAAATLAGFGLAIAAMQMLQASAQTLDAWLAIARFSVSAALLGACFVGIACLVSALTTDKSRAAGLALIVWLATVVVFDLVLLALLVVSGGNPVERAVYPYLLLANPVDVFRLVNLTALGQGAGNELLTGMTAGHGYPAVLLWLVLVAWVVVPFALAMFVFRRKEV
jgi:Cu-processing system permease protein